MHLRNAKLLDGQQLEFGSFNVVIGGNAVGKTTFINEVYSRTTNESLPEFYWIEETTAESSDVPRDVGLILGSLSRQWEGSNMFYHSTASKLPDGSMVSDNNLRFSDAERKQFREGKHRPDLFNELKFRRPFIVSSNCESRLSLQDQVQLRALNTPPQDPINVLYRDRELMSRIDETIQNRFQYNFVILDHVKTSLELGISKELPPEFDNNASDLQEEFEKIEEWKRENFIPMSRAGHGIRSMIRLLSSLFEPVNQVILIDEPEMHLYPAQKQWLGETIVKLSKEQGKQVFLVTHDPMILRGVLDAKSDTKVFRIDRDAANKGVVRYCEIGDLSDTMTQANQDQFLQGLFYQRCVAVEGASDRFFYQTLFGDCPEMDEADLGFVACGGKGGTKHVAKMAAAVELPSAFVYDFDVLLFEAHTVKDVYAILGGTGNPLEDLENALEADTRVAEAKDAKARNKAVKTLTGYTDRGGVAKKWVTPHQKMLNDTLASLSAVGIFVIPYGSLESWAPEVGPKPRFAELAPPAIRSDPKLLRRFEDFADSIFAYFGLGAKEAAASKMATGDTAFHRGLRDAVLRKLGVKD